MPSSTALGTRLSSRSSYSPPQLWSSHVAASGTCLLLLLLALLVPHSHAAVPANYYCQTYQTNISNDCPLCQTGTACAGIQTADNYYQNPAICTLPNVSATADYPAAKRANTSVCLNGGSISQYYLLPTTGYGGFSPGAAYVWFGYDRRLYITLTFRCNFMFNTQLDFGTYKVALSLWNTASASFQPQYVDVLFSLGYYSCYTLSVDLTQVCDQTLNSTYSSSPNTASGGSDGVCLCKNSAGETSVCPPVNLFNTPSKPLYMSLNVMLASFSNSRSGASCNYSSIGQYTLALDPTDKPLGDNTQISLQQPSCIAPPSPPPLPPFPPNPLPPRPPRPPQYPPSPPRPPPPPPPSPPKPPTPPLPPPTVVVMLIQSSLNMVAFNACATLERNGVLRFLVSGYAVSSGPSCRVSSSFDGLSIFYYMTIQIFFQTPAASVAFINNTAPTTGQSSTMNYLVIFQLDLPCGSTITFVGPPPRSNVIIPTDPDQQPWWPTLLCLPPPIAPPSPPAPPSPTPPPLLPPSPSPPAAPASPLAPPPAPPPRLPPRPPPSPPSPPASPFYLYMTYPYDRMPLINDCPSAQFIVAYTFKMTLNEPLFQPPSCLYQTNSILLSTLSFIDAMRSTLMVGAFNTKSVGEFVSFFNIPCGTIIWIGNLQQTDYYTNLNTPELVCNGPSPPPPPTAPPAPFPPTSPPFPPAAYPSPPPSVPAPQPSGGPSPPVYPFYPPTPPTPPSPPFTTPAPSPRPGYPPYPPTPPSPPSPAPALSPSPAPSPQPVQVSPSPSPSTSPLPSPPPGADARTASISITTQTATPLTQANCLSLNYVAQVRLGNLVPVSGPACSLKTPATTGAQVRLSFGTAADAANYYAKVATAGVAGSIVSILALPCGVTSITYTQGASSVTYDKTQLPNLVCAAAGR